MTTPAKGPSLKRVLNKWPESPFAEAAAFAKKMALGPQLHAN